MKKIKEYTGKGIVSGTVVSNYISKLKPYFKTSVDQRRS